MSSSDRDREERAIARRRRAVLRKTHLEAPDTDEDPIRGAEGVSLVQRLTLESWALARKAMPDYSRATIPCRFVSGTPK